MAVFGPNTHLFSARTQRKVKIKIRVCKIIHEGDRNWFFPPVCHAELGWTIILFLGVFSELIVKYSSLVLESLSVDRN